MPINRSTAAQRMRQMLYQTAQLPAYLGRQNHPVTGAALPYLAHEEPQPSYYTVPAPPARPPLPS